MRAFAFGCILGLGIAAGAFLEAAFREISSTALTQTTDLIVAVVLIVGTTLSASLLSAIVDN